MPEYLAPGVYVEETSFRARSIEGVGTSTTAFAGPTRKGPVGDTPELITSFGDFERIYGGFADLSFGLNYIAHGVNAFFNNGGSRLYVSRVFLGASDTDAGTASSANVVNGTGAAEQASFVARFPGLAGRGRIELRQAGAPATRRSMETAPNGSMVRVGIDNPSRPARIEGGIPPFTVADDGVLLLTVNGADVQIAFGPSPAEAAGTTVLADPVPLDGTNNTLTIEIDGAAQTITLPAASTPRADVLSAINTAMQGGFARLTTAGEGTADLLVIGSDRRTAFSSVTVRQNATLGFAADTTATGVGSLNAVAADDINQLLIAAGIPVRAAQSPLNNRLVLTTVDPGTAQTLALRDGAGSVHAAMGLTAGGDPATGADGTALTYFVKVGNTWQDAAGTPLALGGLGPTDAPPGGAEFLTLSVLAVDGDGNSVNFEELGFDRNHPRYIGSVLAEQPSRRTDALENLYALRIGTGVSAFELRDGLFPGVEEFVAVNLTGGNDGVEPTTAAYAAALARFEPIEDISIVAAPGHSAYADFQGIQGALISHAERRRAYRIAVLDTPPSSTVGQARAVRSRIDSSYAALYYPWVYVSNPLFRTGLDSIPREILLPPSSFVCGIYARSDVNRGVFKAPANEVVRGALRFEFDINFAQQEVLNPLAVNCLRYLPGQGFKVWGARVATVDPEFKHVSTRRYFLYLEASIDRSTQWAVFEPNGPRLWSNVRDAVSQFLYNEWVNGALLGATPEEAFFVRCDRSTMTQNNLDNGQLVCLIGVAVVKPAEFVIFRIGQKTADARS